MPPEPRVAIKVWDLPVRVFHWAIVVLLVFQVITGELGGSLMPLHLLSGYSILVLLVFRVLWGFAGSTHARFASFIAGPVATLRFARRLFSRQAVPQVGHNPLGGWSVVAMLVVMLLQAGSGLFANDGDEALGPLAPYVSVDVSTTFTEFHRSNLKVLIVLASLHVLAVLFHWLVKKDNLIAAMFTGVKDVPEAAVSTSGATPCARARCGAWLRASNRTPIRRAFGARLWFSSSRSPSWRPCFVSPPERPPFIPTACEILQLQLK